MRILNYQVRVLDALDAYLAKLVQYKADADRVAKRIAEDPDLAGIEIPDFTKKTWDEMKQERRLPLSRAHIDFSRRENGMGQPVPNITLKVPTGGGKTFLAVNAISRIVSSYLGKNHGFVLWIVPSDAIYTQTVKRLRDRDDPYRQELDRAAAGRVKIMEKNTRLDRYDIENNLCVMVLMLQSANRETKATLRMFRDRGNVHGFTPAENQLDLHDKLRAENPNLDTYDLGSDKTPQTIKDSLGNALRIIRPLVVVDEGHKATSESAFNTLYDFNPSFVLELTATPKDIKATKKTKGRTANLLVEVIGQELDAEGMIKMPLNVLPHQSTDWHETLNTAVEKLKAVTHQAETHQANGGRYIRPIMLVQVESTGDDQRDKNTIHTDDVKDQLMQLGFGAAEIAIKTANQNDLKNPENQDLLSPLNQVRIIITKQALQEGWDCPFAYVLCALAATSSQSAMTQLVGRILRQPYATKTNISALDEGHIITHRAETEKVVQTIKNGLERDGLSDLAVTIDGTGGRFEEGIKRPVYRREKFKEQEIFLPKVLWLGDIKPRRFDYDVDILSQIDWNTFDPSSIAENFEGLEKGKEVTQKIGLGDKPGDFTEQTGETIAEDLAFDPLYTTNAILDIVLNPFVARDIVKRLIDALRANGFDDEAQGKHASLIRSSLRDALKDERLARAEKLFRAFVDEGKIQFRLRADGRNWRMPDEGTTSLPKDAGQLTLDKSLFVPTYRDDFNDEERKLAICLNGIETINWWHRNVARREYGLQGWRRGHIYPDFIFEDSDNGDKRLYVLESKGDHLGNNNDTEYKSKLLSLLSENFAWDDTPSVGELEVVVKDGATVKCKLIMMDAIKTELPKWLAS